MKNLVCPTNRQSLRVVYRKVWPVFAIAAMHFSGCIREDCASGLAIRGRVLDEVTMQPIAGISVGVVTITDSSITGSREPPDDVTTAVDGSFDIGFLGQLFGSCSSPLQFPRPDQLEIIVLRDGCEQRLMIEINEETAQFIDEGRGPILELTEPVLVPPCEPSP